MRACPDCRAALCGVRALPPTLALQARLPSTAELQAAFEPPVPGLCSQPGASLVLYGHLQAELELLFGAVFALGAACSRGSLEELSAGSALPAASEVFGGVRAALAAALATAAAACARCGEALAHMPLGRPCSGERLPA